VVELRHLRYFAAVAEEKHFGRAARRLRIAQPPLSRQIQAFERELGFLLFDRSRRHVELTPAGEALFRHTRKVEGTIDLAIREAQRAARGETGRLAIGYPSSLAFGGLVELLRAFRARSPHVDVALREMPPQEQIDALHDATIDVGFIRGPVDDVGLATRCVRKEPLVLALPFGHPLTRQKRIALADLAREPFVTFPRARGPAFFDQLMSLCRGAGFTPRIVQEAPQLDIVSLVAAGFGVAIVPSSLRALRRPGLVFRPIIGPGRRTPEALLFIAWRPSDPSPPLALFLELVGRMGVRRTARKAGKPRP
jgi:DNA-binding transcriptional LysR family regulator